MAATLTQLLSEHAARAPGATALIYRDRPITYHALDDESRRVAQAFKDLGVTQGDRVALWLPNTPGWVACLFACARLGAVAIATNTRFRSAEMDDILLRSTPKLVVLWPGFRDIDFLGIIQALEPHALESLRGIMAYAEDGSAPLPHSIRGVPVFEYSRLIERDPLAEDFATPVSGCVMFTTSGTTKAPKFAVHSQASISVHAQDVASGFRYRERDTIALGVLPFCGVYGFATLMAPLSAGVPLVIASRFRAEETLVAMQRYRITSLNLTGDMVAQLLESANDERVFSTIRFCGCGTGAPQQVGPAARLGLKIAGVYGSSEVQALFSRQDENGPIPERAQGGGFPVAATASIRVRDIPSGNLLPHGEPGMLEMAAPSMLAAYFGDATATAAVLTCDGYLKTGDLGYTLGDGRFIYLARMGDALRLSGFLVNPQQIEEVVLEHPSVAACQVVGAQGPNSIRPIAFVLLKPAAALDEKAITAHCRKRMAPYKVPQRVIALDAFPLTNGPNGVKVRKARLREMAAELSGSAVAQS
ncbi:MAG: AMP-binding protein [Sulfuricaulis sp.]|nr:AMP-binding protein [Sulfuricaulis sp.]